jgi:hypothetical protein
MIVHCSSFFFQFFVKLFSQNLKFQPTGYEKTEETRPNQFSWFSQKQLVFNSFSIPAHQKRVSQSTKLKVWQTVGGAVYSKIINW